MDSGTGAGTVGSTDNTAQLILVQPGLGSGSRSFIPHQRFINAGAMHIAAQECTAAVVFSYQLHPIVSEISNGARQGGLPQPAGTIIRQAVA